jgi:two-component system, OmpR family, alkaline phosphatase synthesis response regulator PhoP
MTTSALVVDDDRLLLRLMELNLTKTGMRVLLADSGEQAIRIALKEMPNIILLDLMMPMMDGYEVMRRLKTTAETMDIPIVMLTAKSSQADRRRCEELGAVAFIGKPFNLEELRATVSSLLETGNESPASSG